MSRSGCANRALYRDEFSPEALYRGLESLQDGADGIVIADLFGARAGEPEFAVACLTLFQMFGIEYIKRTGTGRVEYQRQAAVVFEIVREERWSSGRFAQALAAFKRAWKWGPNWLPADLLGAAGDPELLHDYAWVERERAKDQMAMQRMEAYEVDMLEGAPVVLWRYKPTGSARLPFRMVFPAKD